MLERVEEILNSKLPEGVLKEKLRVVYRRVYNPLYELEQIVRRVEEDGNGVVVVELVNGLRVYGFPDRMERAVARYANRNRLPKLAPWLRYSLFFQILSEEYVEDIYHAERIRPGDVVLDVGAHVGAFTVRAAVAAGPTGTVVALEPGTSNYELLVKSIRANHLSNVVTYPIAAWSERGSLELHLSTLSGSHTLVDGVSTKYGYDGLETVRVDAVDNVVGSRGLAKVDVVKIDVEGGEMDVLRGMRRTLELYRPRLAIAAYHRVHGASTEPRVKELLAVQNYSLRVCAGIVHAVPR